jgi:hypothetical protein
MGACSPPNRKHCPDHVQLSIIESQECVRPIIWSFLLFLVSLHFLLFGLCVPSSMSAQATIPQSNETITLFHFASLSPWT